MCQGVEVYGMFVVGIVYGDGYMFVFGFGDFCILFVEYVQLLVEVVVVVGMWWMVMGVY